MPPADPAGRGLGTAAARRLFASLEPARSAVICDFDGTLAPIVPDPSEARPAPGTAEALVALCATYARVAVVSGRPVGFLADRLCQAAAGSPLLLVGLYGLERLGEDGAVVVSADAEGWRPLIADARRRAEATVPPGAVVEDKSGLVLTLHWRQAADREAAAGWARRVADYVGGPEGLVAHPGRKSLELRPAVEKDKGAVVAELCEGLAGACYVGDDIGDLAAFSALEAASRAGALEAVRVAVESDEAPTELLERADIVVQGPEDVLELLGMLARAAT